MTEDTRTKSRTWDAISLGAFLIAIALGIVLYWYMGDLIIAFGTLLIVFGLYMAISSLARDGGDDGFGPSEKDVSMAGGALIAGVGATCFVWGFTHTVMITVAVLIVIVAVVGMIMAIKNRSY